jgi:hypothetical protein
MTWSNGAARALPTAAELPYLRDSLAPAEAAAAGMARREWNTLTAAGRTAVRAVAPLLGRYLDLATGADESDDDWYRRVLRGDPDPHRQGPASDPAEFVDLPGEGQS